jgi:hypothetical protein
MTLTITFEPDVENGLLAQAHLRGVSPSDLVEEIVAREVRPAGAAPAELVQDGPFVVISTPMPTGWDPAQAIQDMRAERERHILGLGQ